MCAGKQTYRDDFGKTHCIGSNWSGALAPVGNHLIGLLPHADRLRLLKVCDPVPLVVSEVLAEPDAPTHHVWFPTDGSISLMTRCNGDLGLEVGMAGQEGMLGAHLALGVRTQSLHAVVRDAGSAWCVGAAGFERELTRNPALRGILCRYIGVLMAQLTTSIVCVQAHQIGQRLARWLLARQDRAHAESFDATHDVIASALGVRRAGITRAAVELRRKGVIDYRRGEVKVLDRSGLEAAACGCYARHRRTFAEMLG